MLSMGTFLSVNLMPKGTFLFVNFSHMPMGTFLFVNFATV